MADQILTVYAGTTGTYNGENMPLTSNEVEVRYVQGLTMTMAVDRTTWTGDVALSYTITIDNQAELSYFVSSIATDAFDVSLVDLVPNSVEVDGVAFTGATFTGGVLELTFTPDKEVAAGSSLKVTFQIQEKQ